MAPATAIADGLAIRLQPRRIAPRNAFGDRMLKKLFLSVLVVVIALLLWAAVRPDTYTVSRSALVQAPPERVFALLADFRQWPKWSPWAKLDPDMQQFFDGPARGPGAAYSWQGDDKVGKGRMTILRETPPHQLQIKLDFLEPYPTTSTSTFVLVPEGDATRVTWTVDGPAPYVLRLVGIFFDMEKAMGGDFERGLANLQQAARSGG